MEQYKTETGRREDLEAIEVNPDIGYIGSRLYPTLNTMEKTGTLYYRTLTSDAAAQTGRSSGTAPTRTLLTDSNTTFTCTEVVKRYGIDQAEVKQMGGIESADNLGGQASKRSVQRAIEDAQIAQLMTGTPTDASSAIIQNIENSANSVRRYKGTSAMVMSRSVYQWIIKQTEVTARLAWTFNVKDINATTTLSVKAEMFRAMLQNISGIDEILIFDDDSEPSGKGDYAAICMLPDTEAFSHKMDPVLGKTAIYLPDGSQQFWISSHYDENVYINNYDCRSWYNIKEFNSGAKALLNGLDTSS